ncbi:hypothetical protein NQZ79_g3703 [Umbelopsis isabellina]|nr:hypothetical protein NQZ79_g3703 [Umbelopsis isabellina]
MPVDRILDRARRRAATLYLERCLNANGDWSCCDLTFSTKGDAFKHAYSVHEAELSQEQDKLYQEFLQAGKQDDNNTSKFEKRRAKKGDSDSIATNCTCDIQQSTVILFYVYQAIADPNQIAEQHYQLCSDLNMTGKVRVGEEGINVTLAGNNDAISQYIKYVTGALDLADKDHYEFFKPSPGCVHVFDDLSVKIVKEICPLNVDVTLDKLMTATHKAGKIPPAQFHDMLQRNDVLILDTRNYYESRIGKFDKAITPPTRKFATFPAWVDRNKEALDGKTVLTYCTGGIRCEKASAYLRQKLSSSTQVWMLDGGIHNYLEWTKQSDVAPLWKGKNYVFDARQSLGDDVNIISTCQLCQQPCTRYIKCTRQCHKLVICCQECEDKHEEILCCYSCNGLSGWCQCEVERRELEKTPISPICP